MKIINTLIKVTTLAVLLIFLFDASGVVASQKRRIITVKGEGLFLDYSEQIYWSEEQFNQEYEKYSANKVNQIPINFKFPRPIDHCHYHIWYE